MTTNKNNNKSMFLYTALIFVVAMILVILSAFGQTNVKKSQPPIQETLQPSEQPNSSITQRAAVLSEENRVLLEENNSLKDENASLKEENSKIKEKQSNTDALLYAARCVSANDVEGAKEALAKVKQEILTADQKALYDSINEFIQQ